MTGKCFGLPRTTATLAGTNFVSKGVTSLMLRDVKVISLMLRRLNVTEMIGTIATNELKQPLQSQKLNLPFVTIIEKGGGAGASKLFLLTRMT